MMEVFVKEQIKETVWQHKLAQLIHLGVIHSSLAALTKSDGESWTKANGIMHEEEKTFYTEHSYLRALQETKLKAPWR